VRQKALHRFTWGIGRVLVNIAAPNVVLECVALIHFFFFGILGVPISYLCQILTSTLPNASQDFL